MEHPDRHNNTNLGLLQPSDHYIVHTPFLHMYMYMQADIVSLHSTCTWNPCTTGLVSNSLEIAMHSVK